MPPALFLDRDGVIIDEAEYLADPAELRLLPGAAEAIAEVNHRESRSSSSPISRESPGGISRSRALRDSRAAGPTAGGAGGADHSLLPLSASSDGRAAAIPSRLPVPQAPARDVAPGSARPFLGPSRILSGRRQIERSAGGRRRRLPDNPRANRIWRRGGGQPSAAEDSMWR